MNISSNASPYVKAFATGFLGTFATGLAGLGAVNATSGTSASSQSVTLKALLLSSIAAGVVGIQQMLKEPPK